MKRIAVAGMAIVLCMSAAGCSMLGGSKYKKASKKLIKAAEEACDAEEASKKQKKAIVASDINDPSLEDGAYVTFSGEEYDDTKSENSKYDDGEVTNATMFMKTEAGSGIAAAVMEFDDKDLAADYFDLMTEDVDEDEIEDYAAYYDDFVYFFEDEDEEVSFMYDNADEGKSNGMYFKLDGKVIIMLAYTGADDCDLLDEFYDFMREAGYPDFEEMLEDAE